MFKIESYVTPILLSYVDKYVRDFKPADAQVSLWGGGVALHNLVLKADVLQQEVALPFTLVSGRIHELLIQVPWTKIMSEPIVVTIDTIECVLSLNPPASTDESPPTESVCRKAQVVEAPPGYMQALVRRIVSNIALRVHHLIVKYVQDDIVMSLNVKHLAVDSAGSNWEPAFADIDQNLPVIRRLVRLDDLTLCLDKSDSDGKIRFYQEPLLYRCQLDFRVLTRLVSANTRRASSLSVQLRSTKLAWGITSEQLTLLLRLSRERVVAVANPPPPAPKQPHTAQAPMHVTSSNSAEPARSESWSEWAWSWLPAWGDREEGVEEAPMPPAPTPIYFTAYFDDVSLVFKMMETDSGNRKRSRGVLELSAAHAAFKSYLCSPTALRVRFAARTVTLCSNGKCVCGHIDHYAVNGEPTIYVHKVEENIGTGEEWNWPEEEFSSTVETAEVALEGTRAPESDVFPETIGSAQTDPGLPEQPPIEPKEATEDSDELWQRMSPLVFFEYTHDRSPPHAYTNPYDSPPDNFEYSDWVEECNLKVQLAPLEVTVCMGLLHRLAVLTSIHQDLPTVPDIELPMRVLTVEECEALSDNLPQRRVNFEARGIRVRLVPWDHVVGERPVPPPLVLDIYLPKGTVMINGPLYPHRVCSAACQMPGDVGPLWQGARLHTTAILSSIQVSVCAPNDKQPRACARADLRFVTHLLLNKEYFTRRESVVFGYSIKIREANICGSAARLEAAWQVAMALMTQKPSPQLRHTTLPKDALNDEESVAIDVTFEDLCIRGFLTKNINTHIVALHSARATALHESKGGDLKQAWIFSGPEAPTTTPYLRVAVQWCLQPVPDSIDYVGVWMESTAVCVDPLFIAWLAYKPYLRQDFQSQIGLSRSVSSTQYFLRRRVTPPSSSGRGASRSGSGAELVHIRPRSVGSSSEPSEKKEKPPPQPPKPAEEWWGGPGLLALHTRLRGMLASVELGLVLLYVTTSTASAEHCATVRDAMERHAAASRRVLALSLGRLLMHSSSITKHLWNEIRHDGPTFITPKADPNSVETDSFPWKMRFADISCYTLEVRASSPDGKEKYTGSLRSKLKVPGVVTPRTVLDLTTTTVTLSVVTKSLPAKTMAKKEQKVHTEDHVEEDRIKYFKTGMEFKPSTLKEFVRGPASRKKSNAEQPESKPTPAAAPPVTNGPVVSLGVHLHADTPPIILRLDHDQVNVVAATLHCFKHMLTLLHRAPLSVPKHGYTSLGGSHRSLIRSVSELEEVQSPSDETPSENRSELVPIFESHSVQETSIKLKTFFWFQWVVSRATLIVATDRAKLAFDIDDVISTVDIQPHYNQLRVKLASASVRHYERVGSEDWTAGVLGGRVLEAREPTNAKEDNHFLSITVTQARISNLPASWKEELHPKLLEHKTNVDSMWEIYATLAPLEAVLQPKVLEHVVSIVQQMAPQSFCPLHVEVQQRPSMWQWPFCYVTAGGLRLVVTSVEEDATADDTFMLVVGKVTINPHPENPICRRPVNTGTESGWHTNGGGFEGRQYEVVIKNVAVHSTQFRQLVYQEESETGLLKGIENPALKWTQPTLSPMITPVLHAVDVCCVLAPALYTGGALVCGPAVEFNLVSDCALELSVDQLDLMCLVARDMFAALKDSNVPGILFDEETQGVCPYADILMSREPEELSSFSETTLANNMAKIQSDLGRSPAADSGVDTTSHSTFKSGKMQEDTPGAAKKIMSVAFVEQMAEASEYLEVFVTMGIIELSLYTVDDNSPEVIALRPPHTDRPVAPEPPVQVTLEEVKESSHKQEDESQSTRSLTENMRNVHMGKTKLEPTHQLPMARKCEGNLPLLHVTLHQPNLYYWKKKSQRNFQVSLFNAWVGLGAEQADDSWYAVLLCTARGAPDPVTDIPPALATMRVLTPAANPGYVSSTSTTNSSRGSIKIDIERPVQLEVCTDRLRRLKGILALIDSKVWRSADMNDLPPQDIPMLYSIRRFLIAQGLEKLTIQTGQIGVCGSEGTVGWDAVSLQVAAGSKCERMVARMAMTALLVAAGPPGDRRHVIMQPLMLGLELEASWEAWRRAEGLLSAREPTLRICLEMDSVTLDVRPTDLAAATRLQQTLGELIGEKIPTATRNSSDMLYKNHDRYTPSMAINGVQYERRMSSGSVDSLNTEVGDHYYKDDLRSGAFKIVNGGQLPMAYQVMLHGNCVSWRYPHPRAVTRVIAFPLPGLDKEIECVLEMYSSMLARWEPHTFFKLPIGEPKELLLYAAPPDAVFAQIWRFRACNHVEHDQSPYEFNIAKFMPKTDPLIQEPPEQCRHKCECGVTAEQLSGVLRVDSYFAPRVLARTKLLVRLASLELHVHNSLPFLSSQATALEGYYVSRPLMRSHRVLTLTARSTTAHAQLGSPAGVVYLLDTNISSDIVDCATGTMEQLVDEFRTQLGLSLPNSEWGRGRARASASRVRVALHVPRLRTLHALANDWRAALDQYMCDTSSDNIKEIPSEKMRSKREVAAETAAALEGRVSLWIHNSCASALRVGQEGTDEVVPLGPGARLAYRWRSPTSPKRLRIALAGPSADWHWSNSIPLTVGPARVKLEEGSDGGGGSGGGGVVYTRVEQRGAARHLRLAGRLALACMLRFNLLYKVRARCPDSNVWQTVCSGELAPETVGRSVICGAENDMVLKIKFTTHDTGWSGDIPLRECPKENVPWLVKIPSEGEVPYMSVWCRVVRARSDGRVLATIWPLYTLHSHLPLDTDVLIVTESGLSSSELTGEQVAPPPLVQTAPGRGASTHLLAPGTTSARHRLSFQYRNIECPVTREAVPLHYGVTETSVFEKRAPVASIEEVVDDILQWLDRSGQNATSTWPYSIVSKHWPGIWQPALLQPRCDVTIRYQAVRAGGGCCLETQLCPIVLMCNATPVPLTLRAHDAAPLCKLEPGTAISPPSAVIKKPFFMSIEMGRETFVSGQLQVSGEEPGRYGAPPSGHVALDRPAEFAIQCNQKVALLTMYYEIKEEINVLGVSSTYMLINRLDTEILVSAMVVPNDSDEDAVLRPKTFKVVYPTKDGSIHGTQLSRLWLRGRWRGGDPSELRAFLCVALPAGAYPARAPVPVRLGAAPVRRAIALVDVNNQSMPVVVTQMQHEGRWVVTVARDPCPQHAVLNRTRASLALAQPAQPAHPADLPSTSRPMTMSECAGARWWCVVPPDTLVHYSSPTHCARYPPPPAAPASAPHVAFLTFAKAKEEGDLDWCGPVAVTEGEQLVQLSGGATIKLRVRMHMHSTLLELLDVDHHDISASDIRRRLLGAFFSEDSIQSQPNRVVTTSNTLERVAAVEELLNRSVSIRDAPGTLLSSDVTLKPASSSPESNAKDVESSENEQEPSTTVLWDENKRYTPLGTEDDENAIEDLSSQDESYIIPDVTAPVHEVDWVQSEAVWPQCVRLRCVVEGVVIELAAAADTLPLMALHVDRAALLVQADSKRTKTTISIADVQVDNLQYETGQFDFAVVGSTRAVAAACGRWPPLLTLLAAADALATRHEDARVLLTVHQDKWRVGTQRYTELAEVEIRIGPLALYIEDAYVTALVELSRLALPPAAVSDAAIVLAEERSLQSPLRLRLLHIHPLDLTLTLHTAVRMYIALDQSPLRLSAFKLHDMMTSTERLTHALTVHYLSAAILGAGWVVGGLELLGAPGALAARVGNATGGVRGVASAAAAALLRSLSAWAGSLARNLDLLAGDEEHARRAAAARRRPPPSLVAGLVAGITNFAINILGAVGGLAHHPLVGVAVGETESSATALRRGLLGALTKPLSATADLVAYAGHGLLTQTGWDPVPQPRGPGRPREGAEEGGPGRPREGAEEGGRAAGGWRRDCVRWAFRLAELTALAGFEVLLDGAPLQLLLTHKFLVVADPESERIVEMIDLRFCTLGTYQGPIIELRVTQRRHSKLPETRVIDEADEYQISAAAMARVARYTGAEGAGGGPATAESRLLSLLPPPGRSHALHAALAAAIHHNCGSHFPLL